MSLPPAEKLSLGVRKSLRDDFEAKKEALEEKLSAALGHPWTIQVDPLALWPYAVDGYAKEHFGMLLYEYFTGATSHLEERDELTKNAINTVAFEHILTLEAKADAAFTYNGSEFKEGKLFLQFKPAQISVNIRRACNEDEVLSALNRADKSSPISFYSRRSIERSYLAKIAETEAKIQQHLGKPVKLSPNFEDNFTKVSVAASKSRNKIFEYWEVSFGATTLNYFTGFARQLEWQKFEGDDLLQEGFFEAVTQEEVELVVLDELPRGKNYNDCAVVDGKLQLQVLLKDWAINVDDAAAKLIDKL